MTKHPALAAILKELNRRINNGDIRVAELADELGVSRSCCYSWLAGERDPSLAATIAMATKCGYRLALYH